MTPATRLPPISQVAYVVASLDDALEHWIEVLDVAPFFVYRHVELADCTYEGRPTSIELSVALGQSGDVQVELIEQHGDTPSIYRAQESSNAHHVALWTRAFDDVLSMCRSRGLRDLQWGSASGEPGERFDYFAPLGPGPMIEVVEVLDAKAAMYAQIADAARTYDGSDPVREATLSRR